MPTQKKIEEVETMFKNSVKPSTLIEDIDNIEKIGCFYDNTPQGENTLKIATSMASKLHLPLIVYSVNDYYLSLKDTINDIINKGDEMLEFIHNLNEVKEVTYETDLLVGGKTQKLIRMVSEETLDEEKLSKFIIEKLIEEKFNLMIVGSPLMNVAQEKGNLGYYLSLLLKNVDIHTNFLLVPNELEERNDVLLGLKTFKQAEGTTTAIIRRALSIVGKENEIKMIGLIEKNTVETIARSEITNDNGDIDSKILEVQDRLQSKFVDSISSVDIAKNFNLDFSAEVETGILTTSIKLILERHKPFMVLVRSISKIGENLNPEVEVISRIALSEGFPVLILWD